VAAELPAEVMHLSKQMAPGRLPAISRFTSLSGCLTPREAFLAPD